MKIYKSYGDEKLVAVEGINDAPAKIKLKISHIIPTFSDIACFQGKLNLKYPIVPCHMAIGIISEEYDDLGLKRGAKVLLSPYKTNNEDGNYMDSVRYGLDVDGYLRDFVSVPVDSIIPLPEEVKEEAIFTEYIAVALAVIGAIELKKGEYIALLGGTVLNNILAQLALYYQAIPIVIDYNQFNIDMAEEIGVYYTINAGIEDVYTRVLEITGGRLAEHAVISAESGISANYLFSLTMTNGNCIVASINDYFNRLETDISLIAKKNLTVKGITTGKNELAAAFNLLLQKVLKLDKFVDKKVSLDECESLFLELSNNPNKYFCPIIVTK